VIKRKGIILAGGSGSRLGPITSFISKHLLPVFDKPMIYYSLSLLMSIDVREILIITTEKSAEHFRLLLGNGNQWGINLNYIVQPAPKGISEAFLLAKDFLQGHQSVLILADNLFYGRGLTGVLRDVSAKSRGASALVAHVEKAERYGVVQFDKMGKVVKIIEKPQRPISKFALTGIYFVDETAVDKEHTLVTSKRGELEIVDLLEKYRQEGTLKVNKLGKGVIWYDMGTFDDLFAAAEFIKSRQAQLKQKVGMPLEIAIKKKWV